MLSKKSENSCVRLEKVKMDAMIAKKPSPKAEDPKDLAAIDYAKKNMGDCKAKDGR